MLDALNTALIGPITGVHLLVASVFFGVLSLICDDPVEEEAAPGGDACC